jgi:hypothetical protein
MVLPVVRDNAMNPSEMEVIGVLVEKYEDDHVPELS